jgi:hypothetical protein
MRRKSASRKRPPYYRHILWLIIFQFLLLDLLITHQLPSQALQQIILMMLHRLLL